MHARGGILDIVIDSSACRAVTASRDDVIRFWDLRAGREVDTFTGDLKNVDTVTIVPEGKFAYSVSGDTIVLTDLTAMRRLGGVSLDHKITAVTVAPDGRHLAVGDESGRVHFLGLDE